MLSLPKVHDRSRDRVKVTLLVAHEQVVVLDADRPVRREAEFEPAPTVPPQRVCRSSMPSERCRLVEDARSVSAVNRGAALDVEQGVVPGVADLAGEQAERIDLRSVGEAGTEQADIASLSGRPSRPALRGRTPRSALPAIADLAAGDAAGGVMAAFRTRRRRRTGVVKSQHSRLEPQPPLRPM